MKKKIIAFIPLILLSFPSTVRADFFDVGYLSQLVINSGQQLAQLQALVGSGNDTLDLLKDINRGINDSLQLLHTIDPNADPGIYRDWQNPGDALRKLQAIYGIIVPSKDAGVQRDTDTAVAEAVTLNNQVYDYTHEIDAVGEEIKNYSHDVSPGGAQRLTAQTLGVMLQVMNKSLRTQATGLKLQAQALALENKREKEETAHQLELSADLESNMKNERVTYSIPRFER